MKYIFNLTIGLLLATFTIAQVPKKVVVEHFTNTRCSICASRNPGFYTNLWNHSDILHITFHPSSPYSNCYLNNHNPNENDDRTKYYNHYGSTPKFTIQGDKILSSQNVSNASLFTPYTGQTTAASISMIHTKFNGDSIQCKIVIKTEAGHNFGNLRLFVALVEDTIAYNAPNGEDFHYDVFRKALSNIEGDPVNLPSSVGDSLVFNYSSLSNFEWSFKRIYVMAILQEEGNQAGVQSNVTSSELTGSPVGIVDYFNSNFSIYPNPVKGILYIKGNQEVEFVKIYNSIGEVVYISNERSSGNSEIDLSQKDPGLYLVEIRANGNSFIKKIVVQ